MKIIHTADIHFESKFQDLDENKKRIRENECSLVDRRGVPGIHGKTNR